MPTFNEKFVRLNELTTAIGLRNIKTPLAFVPSSKKDGPSTPFVHLDGVSVVSRTITDAPPFKMFSTLLRYVGITTFNDPGYEPKTVVMHVPRVVRTNPVMDSDSEEVEVEHPHIGIGTFFSTNRLFPH
jgi:hypothetical protein